MSWRERDYHREPSRASANWAGALPPPACLTLILIHVTAFVALAMMRVGPDPEVAAAFALRGTASGPASILLHALAPQTALGLAGVIGVLWWLAPRIERRLGSRQLLAIYGVGALAAGAAYFLLVRMWPSVPHAWLTGPVGGLAACCSTAWRRLGSEYASVLGRATSTANIAAVGAGIVCLVVLARGSANTGAWFAAAAAGGLAPLVIDRAGSPRRRPWRGPRRSAWGAPRRLRDPQPDIDQTTVDRILEKISREGMAALTPQERQLLDEAREAMRRRR
jgi:hypothetical protein